MEPDRPDRRRCEGGGRGRRTGGSRGCSSASVPGTHTHTCHVSARHRTCPQHVVASVSMHQSIRRPATSSASAASATSSAGAASARCGSARGVRGGGP
eukprot:3555111-Rhodomonas_salina.1